MTKSKMKSISFTAALCAVVGSIAGVEPTKIAPKPPMSWNSFDSYGVDMIKYDATANT